MSRRTARMSFDREQTTKNPRDHARTAVSITLYTHTLTHTRALCVPHQIRDLTKHQVAERHGAKLSMLCWILICCRRSRVVVVDRRQHRSSLRYIIYICIYHLCCGQRAHNTTLDTDVYCVRAKNAAKNRRGRFQWVSSCYHPIYLRQRGIRIIAKRVGLPLVVHAHITRTHKHTTHYFTPR